jgi:hypothetical protein
MHSDISMRSGGFFHLPLRVRSEIRSFLVRVPTLAMVPTVGGNRRRGEWPG